MAFDSVYLALISGNVRSVPPPKKGPPPVEIESRKREEIIFVSRASSSLPKAAFKCSKESIFSAGNARDTHMDVECQRAYQSVAIARLKFSYQRGFGDKKTEISTVMSRRESAI